MHYILVPSLFIDVRYRSLRLWAMAREAVRKVSLSGFQTNRSSQVSFTV